MTTQLPFRFHANIIRLPALRRFGVCRSIMPACARRIFSAFARISFRFFRTSAPLFSGQLPLFQKKTLRSFARKNLPARVSVPSVPASTNFFSPSCQPLFDGFGRFCKFIIAYFFCLSIPFLKIF